MNKDEFLRRLEDALSGEVPASVIRENLNYYADYLSQELGKGRTMDGDRRAEYRGAHDHQFRGGCGRDRRWSWKL